MLRSLAKYTRYARHQFNFSRMSTEAGKFIDVSVDRDDIAVLRMGKKPVNSLCTEMFDQMTDALSEAKKKKLKGVIFTSDLPSIFSAGLDIKLIYEQDLKKLTEFAASFRRFIAELLTSSYVTASAINGHTSAGGCFISVLTEHRVVVDGNFTIGLNDTELGIVPAQWTIDVIIYTLGRRRAELAVTSSQLFYPRQALEVGIVDDIASNNEEAIDKCKKFIKKFDSVEYNARAITKKRCRDLLVQSWRQEIETFSVEDQAKLMIDPDVKRTVGIIVDALKNKKKA